MSGRGKGVRRRTGKAIAGRERTGERGMRAAVNPAPAVEPMARRRRRAAAETAPVRDPAPTPVPGPELEAAPAAAPTAKRLRADESAGNADHSPGSKNDVADALSRFQQERFRRLAPLADTAATPMPVYLWNIFNIELTNWYSQTFLKTRN
ncbi:hypothetical protein DPMN_027276 [Dreissena polymorpha]|uniref:Uncharacterized protein n=1 Tax=Dreissena polymorpha TaxID=45954 RepID=A0A9D4LSQ7_DREPO|nr:hypothetical protein DPMN_027276 [Dreissena polymorpha]